MSNFTRPMNGWVGGGWLSVYHLPDSVLLLFLFIFFFLQYNSTAGR